MTALPARLQGLLRPSAYPHPVVAIEVIETQLSWVVLTGERAYMIKRPVVYPFADFSKPDDRRHFCQEELRLNRRFAPGLYLDVCAITGDGAKARIYGDGPPLEYAVGMRAFDRRDELDRLVRDQRISVAELEDFGRRLARLHADLPALPPGRDAGQPAAVGGITAGGFADAHSSAATAAALTRQGSMTQALAVIAIAAAVTTNTVTKIVVAFVAGGFDFARKLAPGLLLILLALYAGACFPA